MLLYGDVCHAVQGNLTFETTDEILKSELLISIYCLKAVRGGLTFEATSKRENPQV